MFSDSDIVKLNSYCVIRTSFTPLKLVMYDF